VQVLARQIASRSRGTGVCVLVAANTALVGGSLERRGMMPAEYHRLKSDSLLTLPPIRVEYLLMNALFNMIVLFKKGFV
jgi:hypothetical protein